MKFAFTSGKILIPALGDDNRPLIILGNLATGPHIGMVFPGNDWSTEYFRQATILRANNILNVVFDTLWNKRIKFD